MTKKIWFPIVRQYWKKTLLLILAGFAANYLSLLLTLSIGKYIQLATGAGTGKSKALQMLGIRLSDSYVLFFQFFFLLIVLRFLITWLYTFQLAIFGELFVSKLRLQLFTHQLQQAEKEKQKASVLLAYSNEAKTLKRFLTHGVIGFIKELLFIMMAMYLLFSISYQLTALVLLLLCISFIAYRNWVRWQKPITQEKNKRHSAILAFVSTSLLTPGADKARQLSLFIEKNDSYQQRMRRSHLGQSLLNVIAPALLYGILGIVLVAIFKIDDAIISEKTDIVIYILLLLSITPSLRNIIKIQNTWTKGKLAANRYTHLQAAHKKQAEISSLPVLYKV